MTGSFIGEHYSPNQTATGLGVHSATVWRWMLRGVRGRKLASIQVGGRRYIRREDLEAFLGSHIRSTTGSPSSLATRADEAGKLLDVRGVTCRPNGSRSSGGTTDEGAD